MENVIFSLLFFLPFDQKTIGDKILDISSLIIINDGIFKIFLILDQKILGLSLGPNQIPIPFWLIVFLFCKIYF